MPHDVSRALWEPRYLAQQAGQSEFASISQRGQLRLGFAGWLEVGCEAEGTACAVGAEGPAVR